MDKVTRQRPQTTTILKRKESRSGSNRGPSAYKPNALPLGQTGSQCLGLVVDGVIYQDRNAQNSQQSVFMWQQVLTLSDCTIPLLKTCTFKECVSAIMIIIICVLPNKRTHLHPVAGDRRRNHPWHDVFPPVP